LAAAVVYEQGLAATRVSGATIRTKCVCVLPLTLGGVEQEHSGPKARSGTGKRCCDLGE